jgi:hypothetical protein
MKLLSALVAFVAICALACGGDSGSSVVVSPDNADHVAHAALPNLEDLSGPSWQITAQDNFGTGNEGSVTTGTGVGGGFVKMIQDTPECQTLGNLVMLESAFGGSPPEAEQPLGRAQVQFGQKNQSAVLPSTINVEVDVTKPDSTADEEFTLIKDLFESEDTSNCLVSVLNAAFSQAGGKALQISIEKGTGTVDTPENGAKMAFDINLSAATANLQIALQLYSWPYGNTMAKALFLGPKQSLTQDLIRNVLDATNRNLKAAAGE